MDSIFTANRAAARDPDLVRHRGELSGCARAARCTAPAPLPMRLVSSRSRVSILRCRARAGLAAILFGLEGANETKDLFLPGRLPQQLPDGVYRFANDPHDARLAALAFALGAYRFTRYRKAEGRKVKLDLPQSIDRDDLERIVEAVTLARDLDQHAGERHGTGRARGGGAHARRTAWRRRPRGRRRRSAEREFPAHSCGRPRCRAARRG